MSIEQALAENTAAIRELIEAIKQGASTTQAQVAAVVTEVADTEPAKAEEPSAATPEPKEDAAAAEETPTYEAVAAAITKLSRTKGRDAAVGVLAQFNAKKLPDVSTDQFSEVLAAAEGAMA